MFSGCTVLPDSAKNELGSSTKDTSPLAGKNIGVIFVPFYTWKCILTAISSGVDISEVPGGVICYNR